MSKVLDNYSIDTLIDNAYDMCGEEASVSELLGAIAEDIDGSGMDFSDEEIHEAVNHICELLRQQQ